MGRINVRGCWSWRYALIVASAATPSEQHVPHSPTTAQLRDHLHQLYTRYPLPHLPSNAHNQQSWPWTRTRSRTF